MITAIILAAGQSTRMGSPKMLLPWGNLTVLEHVISVFSKAGVEDILVVTGGACEQVEDIISESKKRYAVRSVHNKNYATGEMLSSIQCGLTHIADETVRAALIGLGDQPQVEERSVRLLCEAYSQTKSLLVVPSFQLRRGHPWLVGRPLWKELTKLSMTQTPRDFLNTYAKDIQYVEMDNPSILADMDTPEDYRASKPA